MERIEIGPALNERHFRHIKGRLRSYSIVRKRVAIRLISVDEQMFDEPPENCPKPCATHLIDL